MHMNCLTKVFLEQIYIHQVVWKLCMTYCYHLYHDDMFIRVFGMNINSAQLFVSNVCVL